MNTRSKARNAAETQQLLLPSVPELVQSVVLDTLLAHYSEPDADEYSLWPYRSTLGWLLSLKRVCKQWLCHISCNQHFLTRSRLEKLRNLSLMHDFAHHIVTFSQRKTRKERMKAIPKTVTLKFGDGTTTSFTVPKQLTKAEQQGGLPNSTLMLVTGHDQISEDAFQELLSDLDCLDQHHTASMVLKVLNICIKESSFGIRSHGDVYLDSVLPQLVLLAETDSRRSTRVAAVEALHSISLWMIGDLAQNSARLAADSDASKSSAAAFASLAAKLWAAGLRMAVGSEPVAMQLFAPLLEQTVRWLARVLYGEWHVWRKHAILLHGSEGRLGFSTGRSLLDRLVDRLGRAAVEERAGAAEGLAACGRSLSLQVLLVSDTQAVELIEGQLIPVLQALMMALAAAAGDPPGASAAASARRALAVLLQQWLPACLDQLLLPAKAQKSTKKVVADLRPDVS
eukprot:gene11743-11888_t